jgi:hypothetical protein
VNTPTPDIAGAATLALPLAERVAAHGRFKLWVGGALTVGFLTLYLLVQRCPLQAAQAVPPTALDRWIGFDPGLVWLYLSLWLYLPVAPWLMVRRTDLTAYCWVLAGMSLFAFAVFLVWPTAVPRLPTPPGPAAFRLLTAVDRPLNACPSLHAAMVVFTAVCAHTVLRHVVAQAWLRWLSAVWAGAILYATLATKQHLAIDATAGATLGAVGCLVWQRLRQRTTARRPRA